MLERYQLKQLDPIEDEIKADLHVNEASPDSKRIPKPLNRDLDGYTPGTISQDVCVARLRDAGLLSGFASYEACGSPLNEKILRVALALKPSDPITPEALGLLWITWMHEEITPERKILANAIVGYANKHRIGLPSPGVGANGHQCTFREEMKHLCA